LVLETDRLVLRELELDDAEFIVELLNDPSFIRHIGDKGVRTIEDAREHLRTGPMESYGRLGFGMWAVEPRAGGRPMGICGLIQREWLDDVDVGFAFLPQFCSRGYGFESASAVLAHARDRVGLERIVAITARDNAASIALLEKLGLTFERVVEFPDDGKEVSLFAVDVRPSMGNRDLGVRRDVETTTGVGMVCPCCSGEMAQEKHRGVLLDLCADCQGVWFDRGELEAYNSGRGSTALGAVAGLDRGFEPTGESTHQKCPRCERDILRTGTVGRHCVMRCTTCGGLFLPFPDSNRDDLRNSRVVRAALHALDEIVARLGVASSGRGNGDARS